MDNLKKYIEENRAAFEESVELSPAPIVAELLKRRRAKIRNLIMGSAAAAILILALFLTIGNRFEKNDYSTKYDFYASYLETIFTLESEIDLKLIYVEESYSEGIRSAINALTFEAVPFVELVPEEISIEDQKRIMALYYGAKIDVLNRIKEKI